MEIRALNDEEQDALKSGRHFFHKLCVQLKMDPQNLASLQQLFDEAVAGQLPVREAILSLGIAFGDHIAAEYPLEWVRVSDEYGEETVLARKSSQLIIAPISVIQKRIDSREMWDLSELAERLAALIEGKFESGDYQPRPK